MNEILLNGRWELKDFDINRSLNSCYETPHVDAGWIPISIPGDIHQALMQAGRIKDPLIGLNSFNCRWTEDRSWWFRKESPTNPEWLYADRVELELNELDANALILINTNLSGQHRTTFRLFIANLKDYLNPDGNNTLPVRLTAGVRPQTSVSLRLGFESPHGDYRYRRRCQNPMVQYRPHPGCPCDLSP